MRYVMATMHFGRASGEEKPALDKKDRWELLVSGTDSVRLRHRTSLGGTILANVVQLVA